jgi:two-component system CheB/CheR fusion protein
MPERAIATGLCDVVLPPDGLADVLGRYVRQSLSREQTDQLDLTTRSDPEVNTILNSLRDATKIDFSIYTAKNLRRRIKRRQELSLKESLSKYQDLIETNSVERDLWLGDLLIGVTKFLRDPEAFEVLQQKLEKKT